jgi:protein gp37
MGTTTKIEWSDHTASPWHGCVEVHAGCDHCYAREMAKRNPATLGVWGTAENGGTRVRSKSFWDNCRKWNAAAAKRGVIETVFPSICDPFEIGNGLPVLDSTGSRLTHEPGVDGYGYDPCWPDDHPTLRYATLDDLRRDLFATIDACPHLFFLLLTKRPENVPGMWPAGTLQPPAARVAYFVETGRDAPRTDESRPYRANVGIITSISDQVTADAMVPLVLACRDLVPLIGLSCEPLLEPVDLRGKLCEWTNPDGTGSWFSPVPGKVQRNLIDWLIAGGESGPRARPCHVDWIRSIRDQCKAADVPVFIKQLGQFAIADYPREEIGRESYRFEPGIGYRLVTTDKKGGDWSEWPEDLRVREFPTPLRKDATNG